MVKGTAVCTYIRIHKAEAMAAAYLLGFWGRFSVTAAGPSFRGKSL